MPNRHIQIPLGDASPGMILSDAILDTKGNILLPKGALLTEAILASLARHQIDTLAVDGAVVSRADEDAERYRQIARVEWLFRPPGRAVAGVAATGAAAVHTAPAPAVGAEAAGTAPTAAAALAVMPTATDVLHGYILNFRSGLAS